MPNSGSVGKAGCSDVYVRTQLSHLQARVRKVLYAICTKICTNYTFGRILLGLVCCRKYRQRPPLPILSQVTQANGTLYQAVGESECVAGTSTLLSVCKTANMMARCDLAIHCLNGMLTTLAVTAHGVLSSGGSAFASMPHCTMCWGHTGSVVLPQVSVACYFALVCNIHVCVGMGDKSAVIATRLPGPVLQHAQPCHHTVHTAIVSSSAFDYVGRAQNAAVPACQHVQH